MAGVGNISQIETQYMNSVISFVRKERNDSNLIKLKSLDGRMYFIPKKNITYIYHHRINKMYVVKTLAGDVFSITEEDGEKLVKDW